MLDGLSAAWVATAIDTAKQTATSRSNILKSSEANRHHEPRHAAVCARGAGRHCWRADIRQTAVTPTLTIFHVGGEPAQPPERGQNALPKFRANQPFVGVPGMPEVTRAYASRYQSLPG